MYRYDFQTNDDFYFNNDVRNLIIDIKAEQNSEVKNGQITKNEIRTIYSNVIDVRECIIEPEILKGWYGSYFDDEFCEKVEKFYVAEVVGEFDCKKTIFEAYLLKDKDFLFARVNGNPENVGRCAVFYDIGEPVFHNDHIIRVHFDNNVLDGPFASALLNSEYGKRQLKNQIKTSAGQYTVSQDGIGAIVTILPPIEIQRQFAAFVAQIDKSKFIN